MRAQAHEKNLGFLRFVSSTGLDFESYHSFTASSINERGQLYRAMAKQVWSPEDLLSDGWVTEGK